MLSSARLVVHEAHRRLGPARRAACRPIPATRRSRSKPIKRIAQRRQLQRLDAAHERARRHPCRRAPPLLRRRRRAPRRCRSRCSSAGPASIEVTSRPGIGADDLGAIDLSEDVRRADQDAATRGCGARPTSTPDYVGVTEPRAPNIWSSTASRSSASTTCRSRSSRQPGAPAHHVLLGGGAIVIEGLNLRDVEPGIYDMFCLPLRIVGCRRRAGARRAARGAERACRRCSTTAWSSCSPAAPASGCIPLTQGPRQAGRLLRRAVPHHRLRAEQLHQLRPAAHLHRHPVQVAVAQPAHPHGLEHRLGGARRVRRDPAAAEARQRALVPGHGRRRLPEPLLDHAREPAAPDRALRRSRLQDGLRAHAALPPGARRGRDARRPSRCRSPTRTASASSPSTRHERVTGFQEKPRRPTPDPRLARLRAGVDGRLHLRHRRAGPRARSRRRRSRPTTTSARTSSRRSSTEVPVYAYRFYDENKKASKYWRDIGTLDAYFEANMDLCQVNPEFNLYDPEWPLRTYQPQAPPAKFVFAEAGQPLRPGARLGHLARLHRLGQQHLRQRAVPERARAQLLPHRAVHSDAGRPRRPARADPARHHRSRRAHPARRAHRLQPRGRSPAPHGHRLGRRRRHDRRRAVHRAARAKRRCASRPRPTGAADGGMTAGNASRSARQTQRLTSGRRRRPA